METLAKPLKWNNPSQIPGPGMFDARNPFLVKLEDETIHTAYWRGDILIIGRKFSFDVPKIIGWRLIDQKD